MSVESAAPSASRLYENHGVRIIGPVCTVIVATRVVPGFPLVLAHNRDELLARPYAPPKWQDGVLAPRDLLAGGTWLGHSARGLVACITNRIRLPRDQASATEITPAPSRGVLCFAALAGSDVADGLSRVRGAIRETRFLGFNLVVADRDRVVVITQEQGDTAEHELAAGVHIITSAHHLDPEPLTAVREELSVAARAGAAPLRTAMLAVLREHTPSGLGYAACKHMGAYGTVASALLWLARNGVSRLEFAPGPPCTTLYEEVAAAR